MKWLQRYCAIVALLAFSLNISLPFFAVYAVPHSIQSQNLLTVSDERILLCTAEGFKWVGLEDLASGKEKPTPHPQYKCAACYLTAHSTKYILPSDRSELLLTSVYRPFAHYYRPGYWAFETLRGMRPHYRAPPASIIV